MRTVIVLVLIAIGGGLSLGGPFYALLFYLWIAYFRPESWIWSDFVRNLNLSLIVGAYLALLSVCSKAKFRFDWRTALLFAFLAQSLISTVESDYFADSWPWFQDFAKAIVITYLLTVLTTDRRRFRLVMLTIALSLGLTAAKEGWIQLMLHPSAKDYNEIPLLGDNNGVAVGMLMLAPMFLALSRTAERSWERRTHLALAIGVVFRGLSTYSRGGFLSCGALALVQVSRSQRRLRAALAALALTIVIVSVLPQAFWDRMNTITTSEDQMDDSAAGRIHFWRVAIDMANARPLLGVGHFAYNSAYDRYDFSGGAFGQHRSVHSIWFGVLAELGYTGLFLFLINLAAAVLACRQVRRVAAARPDAAELGHYATALESAVTVFIVGGSFVPSQYIEMVWHVIGMSIALLVIARASVTAEQPIISPIASLPQSATPQPAPTMAFVPVRRR